MAAIASHIPASSAAANTDTLIQAAASRDGGSDAWEWFNARAGWAAGVIAAAGGSGGVAAVTRRASHAPGIIRAMPSC